MFIRIFIFCFLLYFFFTGFLHSLKFDFLSLSIIKKLKKYSLPFVSPDYYFANIYKDNNKNLKGSLIATWNKYNLTIAIFTSICLFIIKLLFKDLSTFYLYFGIIWFFRIISRSFEVILAFFTDITNSENTSKLNTTQRIILAIKSYFEINLNFGIFYYLFYNCYFYRNHLNNEYFFSKYLKLIYFEIKSLVVFNSNLHEDSILSFITSSFFVSTGSRVVGFNLFFLFQIITSLSLVTFAIAGYLNGVKNKENLT